MSKFVYRTDDAQIGVEEAMAVTKFISDMTTAFAKGFNPFNVVYKIKSDDYDMTMAVDFGFNAKGEGEVAKAEVVA